jgi:DNA-binding CsgD family transcriptional regulator
VRVILTNAGESAVADVLTVRDFGAVPDERTVAMVILRPAAATAPSATAIRDSLRLSVAEARLVWELFERGQLEEVAATLGISVHTARSQLKSVFAKTGCHNQAQLIRRVAGLATGTF